MNEKDKITSDAACRTNGAYTLVRCFVALLSVLLYIWLLNRFFLPAMATVYPAGREIGSFASIAADVGICILATIRPQAMRKRPFTVSAITMLLAGSACALSGIGLNDPVLSVIGSALSAMASAWIIIVTGFSLCILQPTRLLPCIAAAFLVSYCVRVPLSTIEIHPAFSAACFVFLPLLSWICARPLAENLFAQAGPESTPHELSITQPSSFLPFAHKLFIAIFLLRVVFGFALAFGENPEGMPVQTLFAAAPIALLLIGAFALKNVAPYADNIYVASCLLIVAGFLLVGCWQEFNLATDLLYAGSELFDLLMWYALACIGGRSMPSGIPTFAWARAASSAGLLIGANIGRASAGIAATDSTAMPKVIAVVLFAFIAIDFLALNGFSFRKTIEGVQPPTPVKQLTLDEIISERCESIAAKFGLAPRETELLEMLAHGRNGPYIQEKLVLSRNTVKSHVANIYAKMSIHSQQELIDMMESE